MKYTISSKFHGTEMTTSIKPEYTKSDLDPLAMLDHEVYSNGTDKEYARRKLAQIKKALCGQADCKCPFFAEVA